MVQAERNIIVDAPSHFPGLKQRIFMVKYDEIGYWSEIKLDIVKEYAQAYSTIMSAQRSISKAYLH
jgi:hypothetical protein